MDDESIKLVGLLDPAKKDFNPVDKVQWSKKDTPVLSDHQARMVLQVINQIDSTLSAVRLRRETAYESNAGSTQIAST